jgi:predicted dehydrogenase
MSGEARRWRAGVIGLNRGMSYVRLLGAMERVELAAVADPDGRRVEQACREHGAGQGCDDLEALLGHDLDFVVIATPLPLHAAQAIQALAAGVNVLVEVTAASTLAECEALVAAVERSGKHYMMAENANYQAFLQAAQALSDKGAFGKVFYCEAEYIHDLRRNLIRPDGTRTWRADWRDPIIYCSHSFGPLMWITGQYPTEVVCLGTGNHFLPEMHDLQTALIRLTDGTLARITISFANEHWGHHRYQIMGTRASLDTGWVGKDQPRFWTVDVPHLHEPISLPLTATAPRAPAAARLGGHGTAEWFLMQAFLDSLAAGRRPPIDVYDSIMMTLPGICAQESSARGGVPVAIPQFQLRRPPGAQAG